MNIVKYALRHVVTERFMPVSSVGKGYSFWNPDSPTEGMESIVKGSVRLFETSKGADNARVMWAKGESDYRTYNEGTPDYEDRLSFKDVGRKKDMLEVVPMVLAEQRPQLPLANYNKLHDAVQKHFGHDDKVTVDLRLPTAQAKLLEALPEGTIELVLEVAAQAALKDMKPPLPGPTYADMKEQLELVSANLKKGMSKSIQKLQARSIDEVLKGNTT